MTKSISSSTRPSNSGSRSLYEFTRARIACHTAPVFSAYHPTALHTPVFQS